MKITCVYNTKCVSLTGDGVSNVRVGDILRVEAWTQHTHPGSRGSARVDTIRPFADGDVLIHFVAGVPGMCAEDGIRVLEPAPDADYSFNGVARLNPFAR